MLYKKVVQLIIYIKNTLINSLSDNRLDLYSSNKKRISEITPLIPTMIKLLYNLFIMLPYR